MSRPVCGACGGLDVASDPCGCDAPPAPLDRAVEALRDDLQYVNASRVEADHGSDVADVIRSSEALLASLDADPWLTQYQDAKADADKRLEEAEAALREIDNQGCEHRTPCLQHVGMGACPRCIARRYFARRENAAVRGEEEGR